MRVNHLAPGYLDQERKYLAQWPNDNPRYVCRPLIIELLGKADIQSVRQCRQIPRTRPQGHHRISMQSVPPKRLVGSIRMCSREGNGVRLSPLLLQYSMKVYEADRKKQTLVSYYYV